MKLRQQPDDFKVEEIASRTTEKDGRYCLYLLEKKGMETFALIKHLARKNNIPITDFGVAGLKDRHAVSKQYMTLPKQKQIPNTKENNFSLTRVGYTDAPLKIGDLRGNKFTITVRDIPEPDLDAVLDRAGELTFGVPNYFDSQRFGSVIEKKFIAKEIMKKNHEGAVKLFLTEYSRHEALTVKTEKRLIKQQWEKFGTLTLANKSFQRIQVAYAKTKSWKEAYKQIPLNLRQMFVAAYQSYVWNECIRSIVEKQCEEFICVPYKVGDHSFYTTLSDDQKKKIPKRFPLITPIIKLTDAEKQVVDHILKKESFTLTDFDIKAESGTFFKPGERPVLVTPRDFSMTKPALDELNNTKYKTTFSFTLPKGSYATIITKRVFLQ
ncbi:MAG: tRNA pseudouridine(13) synthase TruD [Candidatus Woesearchaeota archaeon]|nr:tRNA pseudouridine(13) synthase TruD [Candidatus Woesearchaeota archaeon]